VLNAVNLMLNLVLNGRFLIQRNLINANQFQNQQSDVWINEIILHYSKALQKEKKPNVKIFTNIYMYLDQ